MVRIKSKRIILPEGLLDGYVYLEEDKIAAVSAEEKPCAHSIDLGELYLSPGLIDLHVHGGAGSDFGTGNADDFVLAANHHLAHGTTTILPTLAAAPVAQLEAAIVQYKECLRRNDTPCNLAGIHLEGPYFSKNQCGAQNTDFITPPKAEEYLPLLARHGDVIRRWSYAPELDTDGRFCKALVAAGVLPAAGHTDATVAEMQAAFADGCRLITHLYSCTSTVTRAGGFRRGGVVEYALLEEGIYAELIADGAHLPPELIQLVYKVKGRDKIALITDALSASGLEKQTGELNGVPYIVEDGVCKLADRSAFAGSIATGDILLRTCRKAGISLVDSVYMAAAVPADLLGLNKGRIRAGADADLIIFDDEINIRGIYVRGREVKI